MGLSSTLVLVASTPLSGFATLFELSSKSFYESSGRFLLAFAFQADDLDSGVENTLWLLVIAVIVVIGALYIYRGPFKKT